MYGEGLDERLLDLHRRLHRGGAYRAPPVRRVEIPKPDGGTRPLGIAALEDKVVQKAVVDVILTPIYEVVFLGFSYGFRPGRGAHDALDALAFGIERRKVSWIVDADLRAYFDTIPRDWLITFLEHRIGDRRVIRLIRKWLNAGVIESGSWADTGMGTPQGAIVSPVLANVFLHYVLDVWFHKKWRPNVPDGEAIIVRYADDIVVGFQHKRDAERYLRDVRESSSTRHEAGTMISTKETKSETPICWWHTNTRQRHDCPFDIATSSFGRPLPSWSNWSRRKQACVRV